MKMKLIFCVGIFIQAINLISSQQKILSGKNFDVPKVECSKFAIKRSGGSKDLLQVRVVCGENPLSALWGENPRGFFSADEKAVEEVCQVMGHVEMDLAGVCFIDVQNSEKSVLLVFHYGGGRIRVQEILKNNNSVAKE